MGFMWNASALNIDNELKFYKTMQDKQNIDGLLRAVLLFDCPQGIL